MERFTTKNHDLELESITDTKWNRAIQKLGQLEDIEEELGFGLITLFKALNIIKTKNPRLSMIKSMIKFDCVDYAKYNQAVYDYEQLTKEEFELLERVLK